MHGHSHLGRALVRAAICPALACAMGACQVDFAVPAPPPPANCTPVAEVCDGKDNDCDGLIDEDVAPRTCFNACGGNGTQRCDRGAWLQCSAVQPPPEVCDGVDNNGDGAVDEGACAAPRFLLLGRMGGLDAVRPADGSTAWTFQTPGLAPLVKVVPVGTGSRLVLVAGSETILLDDAGRLQWRVAGQAQFAERLLSGVVYQDPLVYPNGPPDVNGNGWPDLLLVSDTGLSMVDLQAGPAAPLWSVTSSELAPPLGQFSFLPLTCGGYDVVGVFSRSSGGLPGRGRAARIEGRSGEVRWKTTDANLTPALVVVPDIDRDHVPDLIDAGCCLMDEASALSGRTGRQIWRKSLCPSGDCFDIIGGTLLAPVPGGWVAVAAIQGSSSPFGGLVAFDLLDGAVIWGVDTSFFDMDIDGLVFSARGYFVIGELRHQHTCFGVSMVDPANTWRAEVAPTQGCTVLGAIPAPDGAGAWQVVIPDHVSQRLGIYEADSGSEIRSLPFPEGLGSFAFLR